MYIEFLSIVIIFLSLCQDKKKDRIACDLIWMPLVPMCFLSSFFDGYLYYFSGSLCACLSATLLLKIDSKLSISLVNALFVSIGLNLCGLILWWNGLSQSPYYILFTILYLWIASIILRRGKINWAKQLNSSRQRFQLLRSRYTFLSK